MTVTLQPPYPALRDRMAQHVGSTATLDTMAFVCVCVCGCTWACHHSPNSGQNKLMKIPIFPWHDSYDIKMNKS